MLLEEIATYDKKNILNDDDVSKKVKEYKKTSLNKCTKLFQEFIAGMERDWKKENRDNTSTFNVFNDLLVT